MTKDDNAIKYFFERYPDADCVYEVAGQLFHSNAKATAEARAAFYGLSVKSFNNPIQDIKDPKVVKIDKITEGVDSAIVDLVDDIAAAKKGKGKNGKK